VTGPRARLRPLLGLALLAALISASTACPATGPLRLDGASFDPELAVTSRARVVGLTNRREAPRDGMLFVFPEPTRGAFSMRDTRVPLTIVFFSYVGRRVAKLEMVPCRRTPCRLYDPGVSFRFALELRASDSRPARRLGPASELRRLVRLSR